MAFKVEFEGDENASLSDIFRHTICLPWKLLFAFIPPTSYFNGWITFWSSLFGIGFLTMFVGDLATIFGCLIGFPKLVTAITVVALGTSLPDTFASMTAAKQDDNADASVGNVTGSNSVNVFLGLGLPWTISSIYHFIKGTPGGYHVVSTGLTESVFFFLICASLCFSIIYFRRYMGYGELGGPKVPKYLSAIACFLLWGLYIFLSCGSSLGFLPFTFGV